MNQGKLTPDELRKLFPNASRSTLKANLVTVSEEQDVVPASLQAETIEAMRSNVLLGIQPTTDEAKLNKLETRYLKWLRSLQPMWLGIQCWTFKLGHDLRYTPDFIALDKDGLRAIDTKGKHTWEDSIVKMKCCARLYPFIRFVIAKENGLVWSHKEIKT